MLKLSHFNLKVIKFQNTRHLPIIYAGQGPQIRHQNSVILLLCPTKIRQPSQFLKRLDAQKRSSETQMKFDAKKTKSNKKTKNASKKI